MDSFAPSNEPPGPRWQFCIPGLLILVFGYAIGCADLALGNELIVLELDDLLLSAVNPPRQDGKQKLPRLQYDVHGSSGC